MPVQPCKAAPLVLISLATWPMAACGGLACVCAVPMLRYAGVPTRRVPRSCPARPGPLLRQPSPAQGARLHSTWAAAGCAGACRAVCGGAKVGRGTWGRHAGAACSRRRQHGVGAWPSSAVKGMRHDNKLNLCGVSAPHACQARLVDAANSGAARPVLSPRRRRLRAALCAGSRRRAPATRSPRAAPMPRGSW
jgi:hypothetical protein